MSSQDQRHLSLIAPQGGSRQPATKMGLTPLHEHPPEADPAADGVEAIGLPLLRVQRGPQLGAVFALPPGTTVVGRGNDVDVLLEDPTVSRHHAILERTGSEVVLRDGGSLNGTYVNRYPCSHAVLAEGDHIWIGKFRLTFHDR
ncbi:MAG: FHA domain-containing protein [Sciscionella sp.]